MRRLDPEQIGLLLHNTWLAWRAKLDGRLRPLGLSQGKWRTLVHLSKGGDQLSQSELAARMGIEEPTLVGLLRRLETDGWIKRRDASHDRRCKNVRLARKSSPVLHQIFDTARQLRHELIATVPERDLQTCMRVLAQIRERAEATDVQMKNGRMSARDKKR
jgi:MarR family transcriptional regulator, transcriptional regulator for hemolysin